jgi:hypothetical protein
MTTIETNVPITMAIEPQTYNSNNLVTKNYVDTLVASVGNGDNIQSGVSSL